MTKQTQLSKDHRVRRVHVVGKKNSGKTTLVCELVTLLTQQGFSVATIKHTHHNHELDTTGKDSWQHRQAGATAVGILASEMTAVFFPMNRSQNEFKRYAHLESVLCGCDLILVEGDLHCDAPKLEVWRHAVSSAPYAVNTPGIGFVVTDDQCQQFVDKLNSGDQPQDNTTPISFPPRLNRSHLSQIADAVIQLAGL